MCAGLLLAGAMRRVSASTYENLFGSGWTGLEEMMERLERRCGFAVLRCGRQCFGAGGAVPFLVVAARSQI